MAIQITREQAYEQGRRAGAAVAQDIPAARQRARQSFQWARAQYPGSAELDFERALPAFDAMRTKADLDLTKYPECRGLREVVEAERRGFRDACGDTLLLALHFNWYWFISRVLNVRCVGKAPPPSQCTDFWFAETREGGPLNGSNRDDVRENYTSFPTPGGSVADRRITRISQAGGVSSAVLCDEEPEEWFPVNMDWITPEDIRTLPEYMRFLERYRDFWGPGNKIYVDPDLNFVAVEKANRRMGLRYSTDGCCAITAGAYLTPEMAAFKKERDAMSFKVRGWSEDNPDARYWEGCERRYRRLLKLVDEENRRGATLLGAAHIAMDHAVPFPDRVCLAGERGHPEEALQNWTLQSHVCCGSGPNRRMLCWQMDPTKPVPIYRTTPWYLPGDGSPMRPEWERELAEAGDIGGPR